MSIVFCFFQGAAFWPCVRASGHGVLRFRFLLGLYFERALLFLLFFGVSSSCHRVLFLLMVFFGLSKPVRFLFRGVVDWPVCLLQAIGFCVLNFYTDSILSARSRSCFLFLFFVLPSWFLFCSLCFWGCKVFFAVLFVGMCLFFRPWCFVFFDFHTD